MERIGSKRADFSSLRMPHVLTHKEWGTEQDRVLITLYKGDRHNKRYILEDDTEDADTHIAYCLHYTELPHILSVLTAFPIYNHISHNNVSTTKIDD